jgi:cell division protein FtsB
MLFATAVVLVNALVGEHGLVASLRARYEYVQEESQLARLRAENARLREQVRRLTSDRDTIEALARTELGLIRPGEVLFIVRPAPATSGSPEQRR